ncbi:hypothetical protein KC354_g6234 [Hortaea werneckii]|nr:hypothetical protein KC354_g6234 [Hortaea werneckii]
MLTMNVDEIDAATLMPLETPPLKVSRPVAACSRCRNAKIKCDGKLPACSSCEKNGRAAECTSTNDQFARGKERSYVSTLETRIDKLQARLEEAKARKPSVVSIPDDETAVPSRRPSYNVPALEHSSAGGSRAQRRKEASAIDDLVSDFGFLSVNATARDFYGFTSAMSYARLILSACSKDPLPSGTTKELPPRYSAASLIQHYLNNVFTLVPVFEEASFYGSVDNAYAQDTRKADPFDHWVVRMVLAIASASMSEQRGDQHYLEGIGHVCAALSHAEGVLNPGSISSVQALVMLTEYAMLDPHHFDSWSLIGAASRAMVDLGLHTDPPKGTPMTKGKLDLRRRVFWCVYVLDRSTSLVQTRAFSFSDDSVRVKIPFTKAPAVLPAATNKSGLQKPWVQSHEQALDLIHLRQIQSGWYTDLFQSGRTTWDEPYHYLWSTCETMRKWFENISVTTNPSMRVFFELELLYSYIYVLSPSPRVPAISPFAAKLIFEYCIRYADLMLRLVDDANYTPPLTFYDAMRVYMTGRQFLDVLQHNTDPLLNGHIPPHPEVKPTTAPPPAMPVVNLPPGDTLQRFNTVRSIHCIKQISECLAKFGMRWGYMSWNQRYQSETASMLETLHLRLREFDGISAARRPSMWHASSSASSVTSSSAASQAYRSPQSLTSSSAAYRQPSITAHHMASFGDSGPAPQVTPPLYYHQQTSSQQPPMQPWETQTSFFEPSGSQSFSFGQPVSQPGRSSAHGNPNLQFANWTGYGGASSVPGTLDEENAVPPNAQSWNPSEDSLSSQALYITPARRMASTQQQPDPQMVPSSDDSSSSQALYIRPRPRPRRQPVNLRRLVPSVPQTNESFFRTGRHTIRSDLRDHTSDVRSNQRPRRLLQEGINIMEARHQARLATIESKSGTNSPLDEENDPVNRSFTSNTALQSEQMRTLQEGQRQMETQLNDWSSGPESEGLMMIPQRNPRNEQVHRGTYSHSPLRHVQNTNELPEGKEGSSEVPSGIDYFGQACLQPRPQSFPTFQNADWPQSESQTINLRDSTNLSSAPLVPRPPSPLAMTGTDLPPDPPLSQKRKASMQDHFLEFQDCWPSPQLLRDLGKAAQHESTPSTRVLRSPKMRKKDQTSKPLLAAGEAGPSRPFDGAAGEVSGEAADDHWPAVDWGQNDGISDLEDETWFPYTAASATSQRPPIQNHGPHRTIAPPPEDLTQTSSNRFFPAPSTASPFPSIPPPHSFLSADPNQLPPNYPNFVTYPGLGWMCTTCHLITQSPHLHSSNGDWCFDVLSPDLSSHPARVLRSWAPLRPSRPSAIFSWGETIRGRAGERASREGDGDGRVLVWDWAFRTVD